MIDITAVIKAIVWLLVAILTTFVIPWIKTKVNAEKLEEAQKWVRIAVQAAEMIYNESGMGDFKKKYVLAFLESKGYTFNEESLNNMIESAVLELKAKGADV